MKLVKVGNIILNMDQLIAAQIKEQQLILVLSGINVSGKQLTINLEGENSIQMIAWLNRNGINELTQEISFFDYDSSTSIFQQK